tara:strand:+ start:3755 stop:4108 length:354 start_codon:yes stop_codon:yes gene_type:complete
MIAKPKKDKLKLQEISLGIHNSSGRVMMRRHSKDDKVLEEADITAMVVGLAAASMTSMALQQKLPGASIPFEGEEGVQWIMSVQKAGPRDPMTLPEPGIDETPLETTKIIRPPGFEQ